VTEPRTDSAAATGLRTALSKVPEVTAYFWVIKVLTTGMGEAAADFMVHGPGPAVAVAVSGTGLLVALALQFRADRYRAWVYWFAVVMVSVFGTLAADGLRIGLGLPYWVTTLGFSVALAVVFAAWYASEKTLSIHSIVTRRREAFYWATVMATFALGTAAGDWTAITLGLGFAGSAVLFAALIAIPACAYRWLGLNAIVAFWAAYVVTRPLGASLADWMARPVDHGGLGWGDGPVVLAWTAAIVGFVTYLAVSKRDVAASDRA
jgi:uncharacterized membrane-anchored protein